MNKQKGFTLIELLIVAAIMCIGFAIIGGAISTYQHHELSWGVNGAVETRCIDGYKVLVSSGGRYNGTQVEQLKDENGKAITCK